MPHQNGAGPDHRGDGREAQSSVDSRPHTKLQLVRADLIGVDTRTATPLQVYRGAALALTMRIRLAPIRGPDDRLAARHGPVAGRRAVNRAHITALLS